MPYATLAELRAYVGIPPVDTADDAMLTLALDSASAQVDAYCDRGFDQDASPTVRVYKPQNLRELDVEPFATTTGLVVKTDDNGDGVFETTWTLGTDYRLEPMNAPTQDEPWTRLVALGTRWFPMLPYRPGVEVTARFGWGAGVPSAVKQATLIQATRLFKRQVSPFGVAGSVEFGSEVRLLDELDRDVQRLLKPYRRTWWVL